MESFENKEKILGLSNEKIKQELKNFFNELLIEAKNRLKQNKDFIKEKPEYIGEGPDSGYDVKSIFWEVYSDNNRAELKEKLKFIAEIAKSNYENFVKENSWEKAEDWELSENSQFEHLICDIVEPYLRSELDKINNNA